MYLYNLKFLFKDFRYFIYNCSCILLLLTFFFYKKTKFFFDFALFYFVIPINSIKISKRPIANFFNLDSIPGKFLKK